MINTFVVVIIMYVGAMVCYIVPNFMGPFHAELCCIRTYANEPNNLKMHNIYIY